MVTYGGDWSMEEMQSPGLTTGLLLYYHHTQKKKFVREVERRWTRGRDGGSGPRSGRGPGGRGNHGCQGGAGGAGRP